MNNDTMIDVVKKVFSTYKPSDIENILQEMESCAKQGKDQYAFEGSLTAMQKEKLKELEYQVQTGQQYNVPWAIISW